MSSSSSHPQSIHYHDVFLNFRGEDARDNFVSHLHAALSNAGIDTFLDDQLHKGTEVGPELLRAIEGSQISLVIFSENYADSSWCLDELVKIMEWGRTCGQFVVPIFYHVDPSIVRSQEGAFGQALEATAKKRCSEREMQDVLSRWRSALTQAANTAGWDSSTVRNEGELVKLIVDDVLKKLSITLSLTEFPVGLESRMQKVIEFIENQSSKVCMVGIWGMGGSGKTTLAKAIYNKFLHKFVDRSFIEDVREVCAEGKRGITHLQEQLLSNVQKTKAKIYSIAMGRTMIQKKLQGKRALVILDDVTTSEQLDALCVNRIRFGSGSVVIVTTRDERLLTELKVDYVCTMKEMDQNESLELFSRHAFREPSPREDFSELSTNVVTYCGGLPLALEVLGSYLCKRTKPQWESVLSKLERNINDQVQEKLRKSYDGLKDDMEKDIFLDICCFFIGKDRAYVTEILNGCGLCAEIGIAVLIEQSLLKVEKNKLQMHDLLRDMGREIIRQGSAKELGKRSRLSCHDDVHDVLTNNTGTETVEGLVLKLQRTSRVCFNTDSFKQMKKLRLLQLDCVDLTGDFGYLCKQLRWVKWQGFALKCIPDDFYKENLVVVDLKHSNIKQVWKETKLLLKLKILNLSHSKYLKSTPDFSKLPNLEKLIMKDCPSLSGVHPSIGDLSNILLINLKDCTSLSNLPREIYQLKSLKTLILSGCSKIDKLEEDIVQMESLMTLIAKDTAVKEVPYSIVMSKSIAYISLCGYEGFSCDIFPSLIWSWISPTMSPLPHIPPCGGMSLSLVSLDVESNNLGLGYLSPMISSLSKLRSVRVQCNSEIQLTHELRRFLGDLYDAYFSELETSHASQIPDLSLKSLLIGMGNYHIVTDTLCQSISQGLTTNDSSDSFLPGDNYPSWLAYTCEGPSVLFQVPEDHDCCMKGISLCVVYSSTPENMATECLASVLIINYTKFTIHTYKRDTIISFNDEDWQGVISNLGVGDNVEIFVAFGRGLTVKETAVYLIYGQSITTETERSIFVEVEPPTDVNMETSPGMNVQPSPNVKTKPSPEKEVQPSPSVKMDPAPEEGVQPSPNFHSPPTEGPQQLLELVEEHNPPNVGNTISGLPKVEPSTDVKMEPSPEVNVQPSPNVKTEPSPEQEARPSPNVKMEPSLNVKKEPLPKPNKKIFTRLAKRVGECLCLN